MHLLFIQSPDGHRLIDASAVCAVTGLQDFFTMPIVQYQRDGRVWRGLQKGALSLKTSAQLAVLDLLLKLLDSVQVNMGIINFATVRWMLLCHIIHVRAAVCV